MRDEAFISTANLGSVQEMTDNKAFTHFLFPDEFDDFGEEKPVDPQIVLLKITKVDDVAKAFLNDLESGQQKEVLIEPGETDFKYIRQQLKIISSRTVCLVEVELIKPDDSEND